MISLRIKILSLLRVKLTRTTVLVLRMAHRKWKVFKQQPSMLPGPAVPGCCWISLHFLWGKLSTCTVYWRKLLVRTAIKQQQQQQQRQQQPKKDPDFLILLWLLLLFLKVTVFHGSWFWGFDTALPSPPFSPFSPFLQSLLTPHSLACRLSGHAALSRRYAVSRPRGREVFNRQIFW